MNVIASREQLRASFIRWSLFTVPLILLLGFLSAQLGSPESYWYQDLVKPEFNPEPIVFRIVWPILFIMIGLALAMVCSAWGARGRGIAIGLFVLHFLLNMAWTPVFFGNQDIQGGLIVIGLADVTLLALLWAFWRVRRSAGLMLLPYLAWLLFATLLNFQFLQLNPDGGQTSTSGATQRIEL
ncbi:TspO/MBR family protein [Altererythrobacter sp.]|uniref:TspO/MBR family protein n=1 Tax=Altererythrobacter sp. TaxID=1872480 RepID=UPI003D10E355